MSDTSTLASSMAYAGAQPVDRKGMVSGLEHLPSAVLAVAGARVYHTKLELKDSQWNYSQWKGTLTFGKDLDTAQTLTHGTSETEKHWFRLADSETGRTVWMFKFPENFEYVVDRPFFHVFQGRTRRYGFLFNDDDEAALFGKKVFSQIYNGQPSATKKSRKHGAVRSKSLSSAQGVRRAVISSPAPNSFKHVAHVGVNKDGLFETTKDLDNAWKTMLTDLQGHGVSEAVVLQHNDFVEGFWKGVEAAQKTEPTDPAEVIAPQKDITRRPMAISAF